MKTFDYQRPGDVASALALLAGERSTLLGGGTNLVDLMKIGVTEPDVLVDVSHLPLDSIDVDGAGRLHIGGTARNSDLAAHPDVRGQFPVLAQALLAGASGQLRNAATTAGNLLQRTRCPYFMDVTKPCNKRAPGSGCPAREGNNRMHAVLGSSPHCIATHPSDMAVALAALDAQVVVQGGDGERLVALDELYRLPGDTPHVETTLHAGEIITGVEVAALPVGARSTYRKVRDRASYAFAVVSIAAVLTVHDATIADIRLAFGGVAAKPWRARTAEEALRGGPATREAIVAALDAELAAAQPLPQNAFKIPLLRRLGTATLAGLTGEAQA